MKRVKGAKGRREYLFRKAKNKTRKQKQNKDTPEKAYERAMRGV